LGGVRAAGGRLVGALLTAQQNDATLTAPALQPQRRLLALPALTGIRPVRLLHRALQGSLHIQRHAQAEQIRQTLLFGPRHDPLDAP
jgi:hypothetical protein